MRYSTSKNYLPNGDEICEFFSSLRSWHVVRLAGDARSHFEECHHVKTLCHFVGNTLNLLDHHD